MTVPFGDGVVEVGAEWMHGTEGSIVYQTAIENNITVFPQKFDFQMLTSDGSTDRTALIKELVNFCIEASEVSSDKPEPLGTYITRRLMDYLKENHPDVLNDQEFISDFLSMMNQIINTYEASNDWNDVNAQMTYENLEGSQVMSWHRYGYKTFFDLLLNTYNNGPGIPNLDIKLNKEVTLIKWPQNTTGSVQVFCKDGDVYTADNVIVTVSLGVLKERYSSLFSPPLPNSKLESIENLSIGVEGKIILAFPEKLKLPTGASLFWKTADKKQISQEDSWITKTGGTSSGTGSSNTITIWISGDIAKLVETLPEDVVKRKSMELLRRFMGRNTTIPEPTGMIRSQWYLNPFTRGSYTYDNLLAHKYPHARSVLAAPLTDASGAPRVLFAGEATHDSHFSTVHGASETGRREALRLLPSGI